MGGMVSTPVPVEFDEGNAFDDWIAGGSVAKRSVVVYANPGLYAEYQHLENEYAIAKAREADGAELAGSESEKILGRMEALYDEWMASRANWIVQALSQSRIRECEAMEPALTEPVEPPRPILDANASETAQRSHTVKMQKFEKEYAAYVKALEAYNDELNMRCLAAATERIEFADGRTVSEISVEQIRTMRATIGDLQVTKLASAVTLSTIEEPEIPAPFSLRTSEDDQT